MDTHKRSLMKSIVWRLVSLIIVFTVSLLVTKSLAMATSISVVDTAIKMICYYFHERIWAKINWGRVEI